MRIDKLSFCLFAIAVLLPVHHAGARNMEPVNIEPLLTTKWEQDGPYALFTPHNLRLGCWSVALSQILSYHKLQPTGKVKYQGTGYSISEALGMHQFNWKLFTDSLTSPPKSEEVPRYCYYTAIAIGKNFVEDNAGEAAYMGNSNVRRQGIEKHFPPCKTKPYPKAPEEAAARQAAIIAELKQKRPLLLYIEGVALKSVIEPLGLERLAVEVDDNERRAKDDIGHALVIDGARNTNGKFEVHLNFGWHGHTDDEWYELEKPIRPIVHHNIIFNKPIRWLCGIHPK